MKNIQSYFFILIIFLISFGYTKSVNAEDGMEIRQNFEGVWAAPDCRSWEEIQYIGKNFVLSYDRTENSYYLDDFVKEVAANGYDIVRYRGRDVPTRVLEDGVLQQIDIEGKIDVSKDWDDLPIIRYHEYMHCFDNDFPRLFPELMRVVKLIDKIYKNCIIKIDKNCKKTLFNKYMHGKSKSVNKENIVTIIKDINVISEAIANRSINNQDISYIAKDILIAFDSNKDKILSLDEVLSEKEFWTNESISQKTKEKLKYILGTLSEYFPI